MTIKDIHGEKTTPKRQAQNFMFGEISNAVEFIWEKTEMECEGMTDREKVAFRDQVLKQADRFTKAMGYDTSGNWWNK